MSSKRKLSIALLGNGASVHVQRPAAALALRGHTVSIITPDKSLPETEIQGVRFFPFQTALNPVAKLAQIRKILAEVSPDILHSHFVSHGGFIGVSTGFHPHVMSAWGCDILNDPNRSKLSYIKAALAVRAADQLLPVSTQIEGRIKEIGGGQIQTTVLTSGIDVKHFTRSESGAEAFRARYGLQGKKIVFSPRLLEPLYNHHSLFQAWPEIRKQFPDARLVIHEGWGFADYEVSLRQMAKEMGFYQDVVWVGDLSLDELVGAYSATDVLVSIPRTDGTPMTVLEGMACGTPLVVCDIPFLRDWIIPEKGGLLVKPDQADSVGAAVIRLLQAPSSWRAKMAELNRKIVLERADSQKCLDDLEDLYVKAAGKKGFDWLQTLRNLSGLQRRNS